ncbi:MAG: hypothetical protein COT85_07875 [Chlamydiae bacterium CG10_big_fil_rev_8_21_14_0_10_42_34]|nr:MAG: hypothetical protein COT85_07875 [Chlamydiae bacterium CG10_big_fil_rev_8_21_14_0_10_42_34]
METNPTYNSVPDQHQNFWQLASIQASASGIPVIIVGGQVAAKFGAGVGITSIILGNLILWLIGTAVISMTASGRNNALQNINSYLGKLGGTSAAIFLVLAFLSWYIIQINSATKAISSLVLYNNNSLRLGAALGAFISLLSIGGIVLIKKYCTAIFPFLICFAAYSMFEHATNIDITSSWGFSLLGIFAVVSTNLAGIVNLPTFFRHSRSRSDSYLGLSLMIIFTMILQAYTVVIGFNNPISLSSDNMVFSVFLITFIILSLISANLVNIYFASAGWEMIFPHRKSNKEYVIIGLLGTLAYTFIQLTAPMQFFLDVAENFIASLGIILLLSFLTKTFEHHRPRPYEKMINFSCWFFGAIIGTLYSAKNPETSNTLIISFCATTLAFLFIIYIEETYWSAKKIILEHKHES